MHLQENRIHKLRNTLPAFHSSCPISGTKVLVQGVQSGEEWYLGWLSLLSIKLDSPAFKGVDSRRKLLPWEDKHYRF